MADFDRDFWDAHWHDGSGAPGSMATNPPSPYLARETAGLAPGTALDAGCGAGAETIWLALRGWQVTAVDISTDALGLAARRAARAGVAEQVTWVEGDLTTWEPTTDFDLVTTHYAHSALPQLALDDRLASWVAPRGSLLVVGHLQGHGLGQGEPTSGATTTAAAVAARLDPSAWCVVTAEEPRRRLGAHGPAMQDVVVRAVRR